MADDPPVRVIWSPRGNRAEVRLLRCQLFEISPFRICRQWLKRLLDSWQRVGSRYSRRLGHPIG
jgi:hypothetical protein